MAAAAGSIPLLCNICPKKPTFSDVSHLLTHIASKGHLSHYYKVKVRSGTEEASRRMIEAYDRWYADWCVEELMSERMSLKEKKRTRTKASAFQPPRPQTRPAASPCHRGRRNNTAYDTRSRHKPETRPASPSLAVLGGIHRAQAPKMHLWTTSFPTPVSSATPDDNCSEGSDSTYPSTLFSFLEETSAAAAVDLTYGDVPISECTRLKGVFWPGMDIFDSATPEMRRKRNQKKDISVVEQLELTSLEVEPTELVFTPLGSLKKLRKISGLPDSDSSPVKDPTPRKRGRMPLADMDVNRPRGGQTAYARQQMYEPPQPLYGDGPGTDYQFTYGNQPKKRKRAFEIFQDEVSFEQPAPMTYLNSSFQLPPYFENLPPELDYKAFAPTSIDDPFGYHDKENALDDSVNIHFHGLSQPSMYEHRTTAGGHGIDDDHSNSVDGLPPLHQYNLATDLSAFGHDMSGLFPTSMYLGDFKPAEHAPTVHEDFYDDARTVTAPPSDL